MAGQKCGEMQSKYHSLGGSIKRRIFSGIERFCVLQQSQFIFNKLYLLGVIVFSSKKVRP